MSIPSLIEMLKAGVHFGHQSSRWHPKMQPYIFGTRNNVHIVDVEKTAEQLERATAFAGAIASRGGTVLFVGTKPQAQDIVEKYAKACSMPYVNTRWLGGTLTNFPQLQRLIRHYLDLKDKAAKGELKKYTKFEQVQFDREIAELEGKIGGISTLTRLPDALFILDARHEKTAVREAQTVGVPMIALVDTNVNPMGIKIVIPGNDDAVGSLDLVCRTLADAIGDGKAKAAADAKAAIEARQSAEEVVTLSETSKATVEDLDDAVKDELAQKAGEEKGSKIEVKPSPSTGSGLRKGGSAFGGKK